MRMESAQVGALRTLLQVDEVDDDWQRMTAEALECDARDLTSTLRFDRVWRPAWGSVEHSLLMGTPSLPLNGLPALTWHRPDGGPALVDPSSGLIATKMVRFALMAKVIEALNAQNLLSYVTKGHPENWRKTKTYFRGEEVNHLLWADAITQQAEVWNRRGKIVEQGFLPVHRLSGSIVIMPGQIDLGFM